MSLLCPLARVVLSALRAACRRGTVRAEGGSGALAVPRTWGSLVVAPVAVAAILLLAGAAPAAADSCPNAQYRTGYSAALPDCRAYELVTPADAEPNMNTDQPQYSSPQSFQASVSGDAFGWFSWFNPADVPSFGHYFLSNRGSAGWSSVGVIPPQSTEDANLCLPTMAFYSPDLSEGLLADGPARSGQGCGSDDPPLVAGEPQGYQNLFVRDNTTDTYRLVNVTPAGAAPSYAYVLAGSSDLSHVVFVEDVQLTADAPPTSPSCQPASGPPICDLYEWAGGVVRLVTYLPDGTPVAGSLPLPAGLFGYSTPGANYRNAVSDDGSRVVFTANGNLYVRENPMAPQSPVSGGVCTVAADACTVQLDASQAGGSGGGGQFMWASADGSEVFFTDDSSAGLSADTVAGSGQNLYEYDVDTGTLTDLTPVSQAGVGGVAGASDDGSYIYFEATGALASGATPGQPNLYLYHAGVTTFIATLAPGAASTTTSRPADACDWTAGCLTSRVSPDGRFIAFNSIESLTGYDNVPVDPTACDNNVPARASGAPCTEIYLYDATGDRLSCASCNPSGAPPTGPTWIRQPTQPVTLNGGLPAYLQRNLSDSGQVFFDSPDALVPEASNGTQNVYEYENGRLDLLSSGTSSDPSFFMDASPSGNDVFIWTTQQLGAQVTDGGGSVYDVRVAGGFSAPPAPPAPCSGDACRGALSGSPPAPVAASVSFAGPGNVSAAAPAAPPAKVRVLTRVVHGATFLLRVRVPGPGRITVAGADIRTVRRSAVRAGTYELRVTLTARARRLLARRHRLEPRLRIGFAPAAGGAQATAVSLTVMPAIRHRRTRTSQRATRDTGGAR